MANSGVGAVFFAKDGTKYTIENDGIITITAKTKKKGEEVDITHENVRVVGMSRGNDAIRVVLPGGGINEIPTKNITKVVDPLYERKEKPYSCITTGRTH